MHDLKYSVRFVKAGPPRVSRLNAMIKLREFPAMRRHFITAFSPLRVTPLGGCTNCAMKPRTGGDRDVLFASKLCWKLHRVDMTDSILEIPYGLGPLRRTSLRPQETLRYLAESTKFMSTHAGQMR